VSSGLLSASFQCSPGGRVPRIDLGEHHDTLNAGGRIGDTKGGNRIPAQAGNGPDGFLDFVWRDMLPGPDDDVFDTTGDKEITPGYVSAIAGIEPAIVK
jgi:hypothetical protein